MVKPRILLSLSLAVVAAALVAAVVALSAGPFNDAREHAPPGEETPILADEFVAFKGQLGDFVVVPDQAADYPCQSTAVSPDPQASELYSPVFSPDAVAGQCENGLIVSITDQGREVTGRRYFIGEARVPFEAPKDRLVLLTVGGKPAIAQLPMPGFPGTLRLAVVDRFPDGQEPGILTFVDNTDMTLEQGAKLAEEIMGAGS